MRIKALALALMAALAGLADAAPWPLIPDSDWSLQRLANHPTAPAVVLAESGRLVLDEEALSSYLEVYRRVKILTDDGVKYGSVDLFSSTAFRVKDLEARTHRPDRSVVELPKDAVFEKRYSQYYKRSTVSFALPEVTRGAIVEYRYKVYFDSVIYPSPWYFQGELPILTSELQCVVPKRYAFKPHAVQTLANRSIDADRFEDAHGLTVSFRMEDMPPVPDEPYRFPFDVLSSRVTMLPLAYQGSVRTELLESWGSAVKLVQGEREWGYKRFRLRDGGVGAKVKELTSSAAGRREAVARLYEYVRDQLVTEPYVGVGVGDATAEEVLSAGRGDYAEKAVLLQHMLDVAKVQASVGWTSGCDSVRVNTEVPNLGQLERAIVVAEVDGERVFLDPSDRSLAFGALPPELEGVPCLLVDTKRPEWLTTPSTPAASSARVARLALQLDADGRVSGTGSLELSGHEAWRRLRWKDTPEETTSAWDTWLEDRFPGYDVGAVEVSESVAGRTVRVTWSMGQRQEDVVGDEASVRLAAPLTVTTNPFSLDPQRRLTPVMLDFPSTDTVELELSWPEGWSTGSLPPERTTTTEAGTVTSSITVDPEARRLRSVRTATLVKREHVGRPAYAHLRDLYQGMVDADSLAVALAAD